MVRSISNSEDVIDSRDVEERIEELQAELESDAEQGLTQDDDAVQELHVLIALREEAEGYTGGDWPHGATLIRDSYFRTYAEELAEDIGAIDRNANWPLSCIDWDQAARELQQDYTQVEYDGVAYWIR